MRGDPHMWRLAAKYSALGMEMCIAMGIGYFGGSYLDGKFGLTPYLTNLGFGLGVCAAFLAIYRIGKRVRLNAPDDNDESGQR